jgi:hypothetical protein
MLTWTHLLGALAAVYLGGAMLAALRLAWYIGSEWRRYPGIWRSGELWFVACLRAVAWPLVLVLQPSALTTPGSGSDDVMDGSTIERELARKAKQDVRCSAVVRYRQPELRGSIECGEFFIRAADLEQFIIEHAAGGSTNAIQAKRLAWLRRRNELQPAPVDLPDTWEGFESWIPPLIEAGKTKIRCVRCASLMTREELVGDSDEGHIGWNHDRLRCPRGHLLLQVKSLHVNGLVL